MTDAELIKALAHFDSSKSAGSDSRHHTCNVLALTGCQRQSGLRKKSFAIAYIFRTKARMCWRRLVFDPGADCGLTHPKGLPSCSQQGIDGIALGHGKSGSLGHLASALISLLSMPSLTLTQNLNRKQTEFRSCGVPIVACAFTLSSDPSPPQAEVLCIAQSRQELPPSSPVESVGNRSSCIFRLNPLGAKPGPGRRTSRNFTSTTFIAISIRKKKTYENLPRLNLALSCPGVSVPSSRSSRIFEICPKLSLLRDLSTFTALTAITENSCSTCAAVFPLPDFSGVCICAALTTSKHCDLLGTHAYPIYENFEFEKNSWMIAVMALAMQPLSKNQERQMKPNKLPRHNCWANLQETDM